MKQLPCIIGHFATIFRIILLLIDLKQELKVRHIKPSDDEGEDKNGINIEKSYSHDNSNTINLEQDISTNNKKINIANKNNRVTEQTTTTPADLMNNTISSASPISPSLLHKSK